MKCLCLCVSMCAIMFCKQGESAYLNFEFFMTKSPNFEAV